MFGLFKTFWSSDRAAVAPLTALSLFGLIAAGGIAFDYARLGALDTELQQAADQAALAAATQLDRSEGAQARATVAIQADDGSNRLAANLTRFANDGSGSPVEIETITFCSEFDDTIADNATACEETNEDAESRFVIVTTEVRTAEYAFTPIVAAISGSVVATAVAGIESSICNVAPLMVCVPNLDWPTSADIGKGIRLKPFDSHTPWAPGNFGLLDFGNGNPAVYKALAGFGLDGCQTTDDTATEPGVKEVTDAINTRFDYYDSGSICANTAPAPGETDQTKQLGYGCPAQNTQKDMVRTETYVIDTDPTETTAPASPNCGQTPADAGLTGTQTLGPNFALNSAAKSFQRDDCHYSDTCEGGNIGDGTWDFEGYVDANHPGATITGTTRYAVYQWEILNNLTVRDVSPTAPATEIKKIKGNDRKVWTFTKQCAYRSPLYGTYVPGVKDRRILTILAADCTDLQGKGIAWEDFKILRAFDVFLTEPSLDRSSPTPTDDKEIYGEIIGPPQTFAGGSGFQYYSRSKPYLVR